MKPTPQHSLARCAVAATTGVIFALGLGLAGMTQPGKVLGFLDVTGDWDPSLACVMGGAALTFGICYRLIIKRPAPIFDMEFKIPQGKKIDWQLVGGATLFGMGWGLGGFCPGPGVVSLASGGKGALIFVGTMLLGMAIFKLWTDRIDSLSAGDDGQEEAQKQEPVQVD